jgi:5-formyltetrahydrofolate cyclo-ligase
MKASLRKKITDARNGLSQNERWIKSQEIGKRLFHLPAFVRASTIMFFASFRSEVDTIQMIRKALAEGKHIVMPKVKGKTLFLYEIKDFDKDTTPGTWGIPEPHERRPVRLDVVDLMIVPGLAFDEQGNRLGYGAGYYDRVISRYEGPTIALAFEAQIVPLVPVTDHDCPIKQIVTEKRIIEVKHISTESTAGSG